MPIRKKELREDCRAIRLAMSQEDVVYRSWVICHKLLDDERLAAVKTLCVYQPITKLNEVDTSVFISQVQTEYSKIKISLLGSSKNEAIPKQQFDLIIVPVLAFDKDNYRLGWGRGWYDRFLTSQDQALKIGLCFQNGFVKAGIPREPHDISLDKIITEL